VARRAALRPLILCYHAVSPAWDCDEAVTPAALERQVRSLLDRGLRPRTISELGSESRSEPTFAVTFDDAFASLGTHALGVLERLGVRATVYAPTNYVESGEPMRWGKLGRWAGTEHEAELRPLSWDGVRALAGAGWEVGSHTASHPHLTGLAPEEAEGELRASRAAVEEALQRPCASIAYPFGDYDERVAGRAKAAGYASGVTLRDGLRLPLPWPSDFEIPRQGVYRETGRAQFWLMTSRPVLRLRQAELKRARS
jgi:peptidoglycan/xylan/chitin deacetylase (PgdA/CDA1 family)